MGFEPMMRVLQTLALPLGHVAVSELRTGAILTERAQFHKYIDMMSPELSNSGLIIFLFRL